MTRKLIAAWIALCACLAAIAAPASTGREAAQLRVMTYNIRLDTPADGENAWPHRRANLVSQIHWLAPEIFGLQEVMFHQKQYIASELHQDFRMVGVGRDDGAEAGESSPIGFNVHRFTLLASGTFWLSPTPAVPSKGWDAAYPRIATWARLRDRRSGKIVLAMNTHWDHIGSEARRQSALLIVNWLAEHRQRRDHVILLGDFNCQPASDPMAILMDPANPLRLRNAGHSSTIPPFGPTGTFNDFQLQPVREQVIDHILVGGQHGADTAILRYAVIAQQVNGRVISDHYPVLAELRLQ